MCYTIHNNTLGNCAHFFRKRETMTTKDYQTRSPLRIFLSYFRPHRGLFLLDISCAFLIAVIDLAFPLISRTAMYHWLPDKQFSIFFTVMALVVAAFVLRAGLYFIVGYWGHTFGILVEADIRRDLFAHMQDLGFDFYDKNRTGQLMSRLTTDLFELTELAHHGPEDLFISLVTIVGALAVMFSIQWRLALVVCCIIPVFLLVVVLLVLFGTALSSCIVFPLSTQGQASAVGTIVSSGYGFVCGAYMPISSFSPGLQRVLSFLPGTYGTGILRNCAMRGSFAEMRRLGFPEEVVQGIRDSVDCNLYFFESKVEFTAMYLILVGSILALIGLYVLLNWKKEY